MAFLYEIETYGVYYCLTFKIYYNCIKIEQIMYQQDSSQTMGVN